MKGYPARTRNVAVGKAFPARKRTVGTMTTGRDLKKPGGHGSAKDGKAPRKGVLTGGGAHG